MASPGPAGKPKTLVLASRQSDLAKIQAYMVAAELKKAWPQLEIRHHFRESLGDINLTDPLWKIPERGVFTEDFVQGLKSGEFDAVIHSWKDLPTENREGSEIIASLPRADARDLLLLRPDLKANTAWKILSSSPRRAHNLQDFFQSFLPVKASSVEFKSVRGNVPRRIEKLLECEGDGLIVAKAALDRLLDPRWSEFQATREKLQAALKELWLIVLPLDLNPPAAAQGALAIEIRSDRQDLKSIFQAINHPMTQENVNWERQRLSAYGGGCHLKIGLYQDAQTQIERGQTPQGQSFYSRALRTAEREALKPDTFPLTDSALFSPRSEDFFVMGPLPIELSRIQNARVRVTHHRALTPEVLGLLQQRGHQDPWSWVSGLESWKKLAALGIWVRGCDESLGTSVGLSDCVDLISGHTEKWLRLTHDQRPESDMTDEETLATYRLQSKDQIDPRVLEKLKSAKAFYWRSSLLFQAALRLCPEIRARDHATGPGATRHSLEKELGRSLSGRLFLSESDWRTWCLSQLPATPLKK